MKLVRAVIAGIVFATLAACAGSGALQYQGLSPEVAAIASKDNKAVFQCNDVESPFIGGGVLKSKMRTMAIDSGTVRYGRFEAKTCDEITFTNDNKPVPPVPPTKGNP